MQYTCPEPAQWTHIPVWAVSWGDLGLEVLVVIEPDLSLSETPVSRSSTLAPLEALMRMSRLVLVLAIGGCKLSEENFHQEFAALHCAEAQECMADLFSQAFASVEECEVEISEMLSTGWADAQCTYDAKAAKACLEDNEEADCTDFDPDPIVCIDVYVSCLGSPGTGTGTGGATGTGTGTGGVTGTGTGGATGTGTGATGTGTGGTSTSETGNRRRRARRRARRLLGP